MARDEDVAPLKARTREARVTRRCMVESCRAEIGGRHLMCLDCWHRVPERARRAVQERLHGWRDEAAARIYLAPYARSISVERMVNG